MELNEVSQLITARGRNDALREMAGMIERDPKNKSIRLAFAQTLISEEPRNLPEAAKHIGYVLSEEPQNITALTLLFYTLYYDDKIREAYQLANSIEAGVEQDSDFQYFFGLVLLRVGKVAKSIEYLSSYLKSDIRDERAAAWLSLGHAYRANRRFSDAINAYNEFIKRSPSKAGVGFWNIVDIKDFPIDGDFIQQIEKAEQNLERDNVNIGLHQLSLANAYDRTGDQENSLDFLDKANSTLSKISPFNAKAYDELVREILETGKATTPRKTTCSDKVPTPIFILGLPRTGSTLAEQVLVSHSRVLATDELPFITRIASRFEQTVGYKYGVDNLDSEKISKLRNVYLREASIYFEDSTGFDYFIDKNPQNFLHIDLIYKLFPDAKIIHTHRGMMDVAWSVYRRYFAAGHNYSFRLDDICSYFEGYVKVMESANRKYGDKIFNLSYESFVKKFDDNLHALLSFLDLEFEESCLEFHKSKAPSMTPSVDQVSKPIYSSSIDSWKRAESIFGGSVRRRIEAVNGVMSDIYNEVDK